jgi:hypothetical protein
MEILDLATMRSGLERFGDRLTGSRAWGCNRLDSDFDYVFVKNDLDVVAELREHHDNMILTGDDLPEGVDYPPESETNLYLKTSDGFVIHVIVLDGLTYSCWLNATHMLRNCDPGVLCNRTLRRYLFTLLVDAVRHLGRAEMGFSNE